MTSRHGVSQDDALDFVRVRWPNKVDVQSRINKIVEECGEVMGAWVKMHDGTGRKTRGDLIQETAQLSICVKALAEAIGFDLGIEEEAEWKRCNQRVWPGVGGRGRS